MQKNNQNFNQEIKELVTLCNISAPKAEEQLRWKLQEWVKIEMNTDNPKTKSPLRKSLESRLLSTFCDKANNKFTANFLSSDEAKIHKEFSVASKKISDKDFIIQNYLESILYGNSQNISGPIENATDILLTKIKNKTFKNNAPLKFFKDTLLNQFSNNASKIKKKIKNDTEKLHKPEKSDIESKETICNQHVLPAVNDDWDTVYAAYKERDLIIESTYMYDLKTIVNRDTYNSVEEKEQEMEKMAFLLAEAIREEKEDCSKRNYHCQNKNYCKKGQCWAHDLCIKEIPYTNSKVDKRSYAKERQVVQNTRKAVIENYQKKLKIYSKKWALEEYKLLLR